MKIIIEKSEMNSERELKINVGDIVVLDKDNDFHDLGKSLTDSGHMFYVSKVFEDDIRIHVISSNMSHVSDKFPSNCPIIDWKRANLRKPSYVNGNSNGYIDKRYVKYKVGHVTNKDFKNIIKAIRSRKFVNQKIENFQI